MDDSEPLFKDLKDPEAAKHELLISASCNLLDRMKGLVESKRVNVDQSLLVSKLQPLFLDLFKIFD